MKYFKSALRISILLLFIFVSIYGYCYYKGHDNFKIVNDVCLKFKAGDNIKIVEILAENRNLKLNKYENLITIEEKSCKCFLLHKKSRIMKNHGTACTS